MKYICGQTPVSRQNAIRVEKCVILEIGGRFGGYSQLGERCSLITNRREDTEASVGVALDKFTEQRV